jgi:hypothetical protein
MDKLQLFGKNNDINNMFLSELKELLYNNKNLKINLKDDIIDNIKKIMDSKVNKNKDDNNDNNNDNENDTDTYSLSDSDKDNLTNSSSSNTDDNYDYKEGRTKMYSKYNKKEENQKFTQTSQKLFDRMFSHAQILNQGYNNNIIKPFKDYNNKKTELGKRKNIK